MGTILTTVGRRALSLTLATLLAACGGTANPGDRDDAIQESAPAPLTSGSKAGDDTPASPPLESEDDRAAGPDGGLTVEYLAGRWCFHRESGGGESGFIEFGPNGASRHRVAWLDSERWEEPQDLAWFQRTYPQIAEVEPDRFVALLHGNFRVVFERAPCRGWS